MIPDPVLAPPQRFRNVACRGHPSTKARRQLAELARGSLHRSSERKGTEGTGPRRITLLKVGQLGHEVMMFALRS